MKQEAIYRLSFIHLRYFLQIVESQTMTEAAKVLDISQPLLSQKLSQMESALNVKLFRRDRQRLYLSKDGEILLEKSKEILHIVDQMAEYLEKNSMPSSGELRIGFSDAYELSKVNRILGIFYDAYLSCPIKSYIFPRSTLSSMLLNGELDFCCMVDTEGLIQNHKINYRRLYPVKLFCVVSNKSPLFLKEQVTWTDLGEFTCLWPDLLRNTSMTKEIVKISKKAENEFQVPLQTRYVEMDYTTIRKYLCLGASYTWLLSYDGILDDPALKAFPLCDLPYPFVVAWRRDNPRHLEKYIEKIVSAYRKINKENTP